MKHFLAATVSVAALCLGAGAAFADCGITAGSVRMPFRRFFAAAFAGKFVRGILLAYLGYNLPFV